MARKVSKDDTPNSIEELEVAKKNHWARTWMILGCSLLLVVLVIVFPFYRNFSVIGEARLRGVKLESGEGGMIMSNLSQEWIDWLHDYKLADSKYSLATPFETIVKADLREILVENDDLSLIAAFPKLEVLYIGGFSTREEVEAYPVDGSRLRDNTKGAWKVTDEGIKYLSGLTNLKYLSLNNSNISDEGLKHLSNLKQLEGLSLVGTQVTGKGLEYLESLVNLKYLYLTNTNLQDQYLKHISNFKDLKKLELGHTKITGSGFSQLGKLRKLRLLRIDNSFLSDVGLRQISDIENLQYFNASSTQITGAGFKSGKVFPKLRQLHVAGSKFTDQGVRKVASFPMLSLFDLTKTKVNGVGFSHFKPKSSLKFLYLNETNVDDAGLEILQRLSRLSILSLYRSNVSGTFELNQNCFPNLQLLYLRGTKLDNRGLKELLMKFPEKRLVEINVENTDVTKRELLGIESGNNNLEIIVSGIDDTFLMKAPFTMAQPQPVKKSIPIARIHKRFYFGFDDTLPGTGFPAVFERKTLHSRHNFF